MTLDPLHCHLYASVGDRRSLCGIKDANPQLLAHWAPHHHDAHQQRGATFIACPACLTAAGLPHLITRRLNDTPSLFDLEVTP